MSNDFKSYSNSNYLKTGSIKAYYVNVEEYACDDYGLFYAKKYSKRNSDYVFLFDPPTNVSFGGGGFEPDPY